MSLYTDVLESGGYIHGHASDLYIEVNETNKALLKKHNLEGTFFINQVTGKLCYDVPFAYDPYWEAKQAMGDNTNLEKVT